MSCISRDQTFRWKNKNVSETVYLSPKKSIRDRMKRKWEEVNGKSCEESSSTKKIGLGTRLVNLDILRAKIFRVKMSKWCYDSEIKIRLYTRNDFPSFLSQYSNALPLKMLQSRTLCIQIARSTLTSSTLPYFLNANVRFCDFDTSTQKNFFFTHACKTLVCAPFTGSKNGLFPHQCAK